MGQGKQKKKDQKQTIHRGYKTELDLNAQQRQACLQHAGTARFAYNWGLARKQEAYARGEKMPTAIDLQKELCALKKGEFAWMYAVSKCAPQEALRDLDKAFARFFERVKARKAGKKIKTGYPRFKSRKSGVGKFRLTGTIRVFEKAIQLPRLGVLRLKEHGYLPVEGTEGVRILSATVSQSAGRWYISIQVEEEIEKPKKKQKQKQPKAGVDLGILRLATVSDGSGYQNPRALKNALKKIKRLQRAISRKQPGSANRQKAIRKLAKEHARVANIRRNALHQVTTQLTRTKSAVMLEDLNVSGMQQNRHLAQAIVDVGWGEFKRQMVYKSGWYGCEVRFADRYYPSTKRCSGCGHERAIALSERKYVCENPGCGLVLDRDVNAARNLVQLFEH